MTTTQQTIDIVFDGPPAAESGRFVEVENQEGRSIKVGDWVQRPDGYWVLRIRAVFADLQRYTARFTPQAWVRDNAIDVDPEGDTEWDCTDAFMALPDDYRAELLSELDEDEAQRWGGRASVLDNDDALKSDPAAPEWIREWHGPFSIYIERR